VSTGSAFERKAKEDAHGVFRRTIDDAGSTM
jgi:hypothetical protein